MKPEIKDLLISVAHIKRQLDILENKIRKLEGKQ
jgi:ubiquinone biosynthesis protein UbiJ